jgi:hypothetical protein
MSNDDTHATADDVPTSERTFRPFADDRIRRRVREDHAPNAALHSALRALADADESRVANVNLMASHAPGEQPHDPRYEVVVDFENAGAGSATPDGVVRRLIEADDVAVLDAESLSIPPESDAHTADTDYAIDRLTLRLRPVETTFEPVEVPYASVPNDFTHINRLRRDAAKTLAHAVESDGRNQKTFVAAKALATLLCVSAPDSDYDDVEPDGVPSKEYADLCDRAGLDVDFAEGGIAEVCAVPSCTASATRKEPFRFPSGYRMEFAVCDDHADDVDHTLLSHPAQDDDVYHSIDFGDGYVADVPHFEDDADKHAFVDAYIDTHDLDRDVLLPGDSDE